MLWIPLSMLQIVVLSVLFFVWLLYKIYIKPWRCLLKLGIKGPTPKPLVGNLLDYHPSLQHVGQMENQKKFGRVYGNLFFTIPAIWIADPEMVKSICIKDFSNFSNRYPLVDAMEPFNKMLFELRDVNWKRVRNILLPTFSASKLKVIFNFVDTAGDHVLDKLLAAEKEGKSIELWRTYGKFTMEVILATAFGIEFESKEQEQKLTKAVQALFGSTPGPLQFLLFFAPSVFRVVEPMAGGDFMSSLHYLMSTCNTVIKQRRKNMAEGIPCRKDILQQMIEAGDDDKLNDDEIVAQALLFLAAGYETTASTLAFASYLIATNPEVQQRVYNEMSNVFTDTTNLDYEALSDLQYLDMVISETMRMYPSVFMVNRQVKDDIVYNGTKISKETMIGIPIYAIHHNPEFWSDPEEFKPERFSPENKSKIVPGSYLPFGDGPRNCIGKRLAMLEVKLALVKILLNVELVVTKETEIPLQLKCGTTLAPANGVFLSSRRR